jgi:hypothetical protein
MKHTTRAGVLFEAVASELSRVLPASAYKHHDKTGRTEIKSAFVREALNRVFGLPGFGWGLRVLDMQTTRGESASGKQLYQSLSRGEFWYTLVQVSEGAEATTTVCTFDVFGGSTNIDPQYVERGAYQSMVSHAARELGFQRHVYNDSFHPKMPTVVEWLAGEWEHKDVTQIAPTEQNFKKISAKKREISSGEVGEGLFDSLTLV